MNLLMGTTGKITEGQILFDGQDIVKISDEDKRKLRGSQIAMIFQEPMTSLNPVLKIGAQMTESIMLHTKINKRDAKEKTIEILKKIGILEYENGQKSRCWPNSRDEIKVLLEKANVIF